MLIVADGLLTLAPFGAFLDEADRYLLERYRISYLGSWRDVGEPGLSGQTKPAPAMVIANPDFDTGGTLGMHAASARRLKPFIRDSYFDDEGKDVAQALRLAPNRLLTGTLASKGAVQAVHGPEILHFATHSRNNITWEAPSSGWYLFEFPPLLDTENPFLRSIIALAGANRPQSGEHDGLLTGLEVEGLDLIGTRLVVLSSCESGQGTPVDGQGVLGLRAAFSLAGATTPGWWRAVWTASRRQVDRLRRQSLALPISE